MRSIEAEEDYLASERSNMNAGRPQSSEHVMSGPMGKRQV